jgi:hypothetical protein
MRVQIKQEQLAQDNLSWLCIEPMLLTIRGKSLTAKSDLFHQLNDGQKALYLFYAYHNHTKSIAEFYWFAAYFISELKAWNGLKIGMKFFDNHEMVNLYEELESLIESTSRRADGTWQEASPSDLENNKELNESLNQLYNKYNSIAEISIIQMNNYIRNHKEQFVESREKR